MVINRTRTMTTHRPYKAAIFDLDGTLLNSIADLKDSVNYALAECGLPQRSMDEVRAFLGNGMLRLMRLSLPDGAGEDVAQRAIELFKRHYADHCMDQTRPYDGIGQALDKLKERGVEVAIVSNKPDFAVSKIAERFFSRWSSLSVGEREGIRRKPYPDSIFSAMKQMGTAVDNSVYVGDSEVDIEAAHNAGLPCISVTWGFRDPAFLIKSGATILCHSPKEMCGEILGDRF